MPTYGQRDEKNPTPVDLPVRKGKGYTEWPKSTMSDFNLLGHFHAVEEVEGHLPAT